MVYKLLLMVTNIDHTLEVIMQYGNHPRENYLNLMNYTRGYHFIGQILAQTQIPDALR